MKSFNLTANEYAAARALVASCLNNMGGNRPSDLDNDPFTWIDAGDLISKGWTRHEAAGTLGALMEKGFVEEYDKGELVVTTAGYRWMDSQW